MRPEPFRPRTWPLSLKVPLQAALFTFLVALVTTQIALTLSSARENRLVTESLAVLAAGVAADVRSAIPHGPEAAEAALSGIAGALDQSIARRIEVSWTGADGVAHAIGSAPRPQEEALAITHEFFPEEAAGPVAVTVLADAAALSSARFTDQLRVAAVDLILALVGAVVALWTVRANLAPLEALTADLIARTPASAADASALAPVSTEFGRLQRLLNERIAAEEERAAALVSLAEQERSAGLAKLAASMAHEVRNPLAGLMNAVSTLRRFGEDRAVREESLALIERGLNSIERVAGAALATYRPTADGTGFGPRDLTDLEVLVAPEARRRGVALEWEVSLDEPVGVDAALLRQVVLNLLLNAVKASGPGGETRLSAQRADGALKIAVTDTGPGLPADVRRFLSGGEAEPFPRPGALGLWTVMRLLDDIDGHLAIDTHPGRGTTVTVHAPIPEEQAGARDEDARRSA
jgi:signal transduction histidine kinase